jgi:hypothetical protein
MNDCGSAEKIAAYFVGKNRGRAVAGAKVSVTASAVLAAGARGARERGLI